MANTDLEDSSPGLISKVLKIAAAPFAAAAGYWFGATRVRDSTYSRLKRRGLRVYSQHEPELTKVFEDAKALHAAGDKTIDLAEKVAPLDKLVVADMDAQMREFGLGTFRKRWNFIHKSQKQHALMEAFTAAGITLGAMFAIANSKTITHALQRTKADEAQGEATSPQL
jgi:hypothetical protein